MTKFFPLLLTILIVAACHAKQKTAALVSNKTSTAAAQDKVHSRKRQSDKYKGKGKSKGKSTNGRKCPADKITIGGQDVLVILNMMGAEGEAGATDN